MIYVVSTYPPKACGIAVFSQNFIGSLKKQLSQSKKKPREKVGVIAMVDTEGQNEEYDEEVIYKINKNNQREYLQAADFVNINKPRVCVIEHEFGIFGGQNGYFILSFLNRIQVDAVVVFHTILQDPSYHQRLIIQELSKRSLWVVVMSEFGVRYLEKIYGVDTNKIAYIPHGVPHFSLTAGKPLSTSRKKFSGHLLVTFGLLSRNKGLETAILAMPEIIKHFPDTQYFIIGKTHPEVVKYGGEEYRNYLNSLVEKNRLEKNVFFINSFLNEQQIIEYVSSADLYVTPYQDPNQITSGTLSYAIGSGTPFVSTPYRYAEEKAKDGCGRLFPFHGSKEMARAVCDLFKNPAELKQMKQRCQRVRKEMSWENVGGEYLRLFKKTPATPPVSSQDLEEGYTTSLDWMPILNFAHVYRLTDSTGIIQHARFAIPRFEEGYCIDDNSRALLLMTMAYRIHKDPLYGEKISVYLSFIDYMINQDGSVHNFLSFDRKYLEETRSDDAYGRTLWSLGYLIAFPPAGHFREMGEDLFERLRRYLPEFVKSSSLRGKANTIIGITYYLIPYSHDEDILKHLRTLADQLVEAYRKNRHDDWDWFEEPMSYDNAMLPLALIRAYEFLGKKEYLQVGLETFDFLDKAMKSGDYYRPIGNDDWYFKHHTNPSEYDQQPIEIMALTWLNYQLFRITKETKYLKNIRQVFKWFLGDNTVGISLYDYETKGCCDGLEKGSVNRNQGAESTLAFWISYCLVSLSVNLEYEYLK